jgi:hypothetical protein
MSATRTQRPSVSSAAKSSRGGCIRGLKSIFAHDRSVARGENDVALGDCLPAFVGFGQCAGATSCSIALPFGEGLGLPASDFGAPIRSLLPAPGHPRPHRARPSGKPLRRRGACTAARRGLRESRGACRATVPPLRSHIFACIEIAGFLTSARRCLPLSSAPPRPSVMDRSSHVAIAAIEAELLRVRFARGHPWEPSANEGSSATPGRQYAGARRKSYDCSYREESDKAPNCRILVSIVESCVAWRKTAQRGRKYPSQYLGALVRKWPDSKLIATGRLNP